MKKKTRFNWEEFGITLGCIFLIIIFISCLVLLDSFLKSAVEKNKRNIERCVELCGSKGLNFDDWVYPVISNTTDNSEDLVCKCNEKPQHIYTWEETE